MRELMQAPLLRLFIINGAMGIAFGIAIGAMLFALDFRGVGELAWRTEGGLLAFAMICAGLSVTCGSVAIATAVMLLPERAEDDTAYGHMSGQARGGKSSRDASRDASTRPRKVQSPVKLSDSPHRIPEMPNKAAPDRDE